MSLHIVKLSSNPSSSKNNSAGVLYSQLIISRTIIHIITNLYLFGEEYDYPLYCGTKDSNHKTTRLLLLLLLLFSEIKHV
jgi:hypothetical protein